MTSALVNAAAAKSNSGGLGLLFPLIIIALIGFFLFNSRKRKAAASQMQTAMRVGSSIMTTAGLYAKVMAIGEDGVTLEVAPGVYCKYARQAIARVLDAPDGAEPLDDDEDSLVELPDHDAHGGPDDHGHDHDGFGHDHHDHGHGDNDPPAIDLNK